MTTAKKPHGGKRKGAGRKAGSGKGRIAVAKTITMHPDSWEKVERDRGVMPRGKYIETRL
jgi:hypothetical protein